MQAKTVPTEAQVEEQMNTLAAEQPAKKRWAATHYKSPNKPAYAAVYHHNRGYKLLLREFLSALDMRRWLAKLPLVSNVSRPLLMYSRFTVDSRVFVVFAFDHFYQEYVGKTYTNYESGFLELQSALKRGNDAFMMGTTAGDAKDRT